MILYTIKIFPNIDIENKKSISELNIDKEIHNNFIGKGIPFVENDTKDIKLLRIVKKKILQYLKVFYIILVIY